jgi:outer membrane lipopolysaccharide assembly protein LptE/RlpB
MDSWKLNRLRRGSHNLLFLLLGMCAALCLFTGGCGYSFSGSSLPGHIKTIAIPNFINESLDSRIGDEMTRGIQESFLEDNRLKVVRESQADCVLEGRIVKYERRVYSYNASDQPEEYIVAVRIAVVLKDRIKNKDLWSSEALESTATYAASGGSSGSGDGSATNVVLSTETEARERCIANIGQDILANALEQW